MKTIYTIAKNELRMMFYSPIAWMVLIIFILQNAIFFTDIVENIATTVSATGRKINFLSYVFYNDSTYGIFPKVQEYLFLYIPLLTMGLMSREQSEGSIKLLFSSPLNNIQIVLGKYLSMLIFLLGLIGTLLAFVALGPFTIKDFDFPQVLVGILGLYLLAATYAAIGLFVSSLTSYQPVAAIATLSVFLILKFVGSLGQEYIWLRDFTYWLSIDGRCEEFINGLVCSEDFIYFITISGMFLSLTILRLYHSRNSVSKSRKLYNHVLVIGFVVLVAFLSTNPYLMTYYDASQTKRNTLSKNCQEIMRQVGKNPHITTYVNLMDKYYHYASPMSYQEDTRRFRKYRRFRPDLTMDYVYYYTNANPKELGKRFPGKTDQQIFDTMVFANEVDPEIFLTPEQINERIDLSGEQFRLVRKIQTDDGKSVFLRLYDDPFVHPNEGQVSSAFKRLVEPSVKVGFLTGHDERSITKTGDRDYSLFANDITFRYSLVNNGFDTEVVSLSEDGRIPDYLDILVIADLRTALTDRELSEIKAYISKGGNLLISGDVGRQANMNPIIDSLGVRFLDGILVNNFEGSAQDLIYNKITKTAANSSKVFEASSFPRAQITMLKAVGLEYSEDKGFAVLPILTSDTLKSWIEFQTKDFIEDKAVLDTARGEVSKPYVTLLELTRNLGDKKQVIVISGDADFYSNSELIRSRGGNSSRNFETIIEVYRRLSGGKYPVFVNSNPSLDNEYSLSAESVPLVRIFYIGFYPFIFLVLGAIVVVRRKLI